MTNEEKAKEIATWPLQRDGEFQMCYACALEMAEWKEQQFAKERKELIAKANQAVNDSRESGAQFMKERLIEKAVGFLKLHMPFGEVSETLKNEVIEDFKKEMKELYNT